MTPRELGERVRELRESRGMSAVQLADRAQVAQSYIAVIESGQQRIPPRPILVRIARALGVPEKRLLEPTPEGAGRSRRGHVAGTSRGPSRSS